MRDAAEERLEKKLIVFVRGDINQCVSHRRDCFDKRDYQT